MRSFLLSFGASVFFSISGINGLSAQTQVNCNDLILEAKAFANEIELTFPPVTPVVGSQFKMQWKDKAFGRRKSPRLPTYLVIATPAASRLAGKNFMALAPQAAGPDGIAFEKTVVRAFVPLHRSNMAGGELAVTSYAAGKNDFSWAVVSGGSCGQQIYKRQNGSLDLAAGTPVVVLQESYAIDQPSRRLRSRNGQYELSVFKDRYEVRSLATGGKLVDRAGIDPNFSPTSRFVAARTKVGPDRCHRGEV